MTKRYAAPLAIALALCGCASNSPAPTQMPQLLVAYKSSTLSFDYPAEWQPHYYPEDFDEGHLVTFLSTQALRDPCTRSGSLSCAWPVSRLDRGGVLVEWSTVELMGMRPDIAGGARVTVVNGVTASVLTSSSGACAALGAQTTLMVDLFPTTEPTYAMTACLSGPNLAEHESEVMLMIQSTTVRSPTGASNGSPWSPRTTGPAATDQ